MSQQVHSISLTPYDAELTKIMREFSDTFYDINTTRAYVTLNPEVGLKIWLSAQRIVNSGAAWGSLVPGVAVDCMGSVVTVLVLSEMCAVPKGIISKFATHVNRHNELNTDAFVLHRRLASLLWYAVGRYSKPGYVYVPVVNPTSILPGDVFFSPNVVVINGLAILPHTVCCVAPMKILSADPASNTVRIMDARSAYDSMGITEIVNAQQEVAISVRMIELDKEDPQYPLYLDFQRRMLERFKRVTKKQDMTYGTLNIADTFKPRGFMRGTVFTS